MRLAAKLTGWKIDIEGIGGEKEVSVVADDTTTIVTTDDQSLVGGTTDPLDPVDENTDAVEAIEADIDRAVEEESLDGVAVQEPAPDEASLAATDAEADMAEDEAVLGDNQKKMKILIRMSQKKQNEHNVLVATQQ